MSRFHPPLSRRHSAGVVSYVNDGLCEDYITRRLAPLALADDMSSRQSVAFSSYSRRTPTGETADEGIGGRSSRCSISSNGSWGSSKSLAAPRPRRKLTEDVVDDIVERVRQISHCSPSLLGVVRRIALTHDDSVADSIQAYELFASEGTFAPPARPIRPSPTWRSADLQVVEALQELHSLKAGVFSSPEHRSQAQQHQPRHGAAATVTYEILQTNFKQSEFVAYATLPGGSCYGSPQACATRGEARRSAACVALVHSAWNELPCKLLTEGSIEALLRAAGSKHRPQQQQQQQGRPSRYASQSSVFSNPPSLGGSCVATPTHLHRPLSRQRSLQKQSSVSSATSYASYDSGCSSGSIPGTPVTPCGLDLDDSSIGGSSGGGHLPGPTLASSWQAVDILRHLLKMYCGRTAMDFRGRMTVFQLMQWSGDLQRAKTRGLTFESVLQAYLSTPLDDKLRAYLAKMWARKEAAQRGVITQALKDSRRQLDLLRVNGSELGFAKEKKSILVNAFALYQRQQAVARQNEYQPSTPRACSRSERGSRHSSDGRGDWYADTGRYA